MACAAEGDCAEEWQVVRDAAQHATTKAPAGGRRDFQSQGAHRSGADVAPELGPGQARRGEGDVPDRHEAKQRET